MRSATTGELAELVKDLRAQVSVLEHHLTREAAENPDVDTRLRGEYAEARKAKRTAAVYSAWLQGRVTQAAAAWVLATVFVRYCEDNELIEHPLISGPGERYTDAEERYNAWFRQNPGKNDTDYLHDAFAQFAATHPTVASLLDERHNPLWDIPLRYEAAGALLTFWRRRGADGEVRWHVDGWDTRFLGDLYQDLSEFARKQYALLQTPEFVEEFILDLTLTPAIEEFGLEGLRTIDPTCGSGHFVLGLFRRILAAWREAEPGTDDWTLIRRALGSVHGVDKNPFAVFVARFRLLLAVLDAAGIKRLNAASEFPINLAVGDSLIHGPGAPRLKSDQDKLFEFDEEEVPEFSYSTEDVTAFADVGMLRAQSYHVVAGNPPYITVQDRGENASYRERYSACAGTYALSVPFVQRFFGLAIKTGGEDRRAGHVGQITANSFVKREFGAKLIRDFLPTMHVTHVVDTSGAYIPGHGTPTVILFGRNHMPRAGEPVCSLLSVRGEPNQPEDPSMGKVWSAIVQQIGRAPSESPWVSVAYADRSRMVTHPWTVLSGAPGELYDQLMAGSRTLRASLSRPIGFASFPGQDEVFFLTDSWFRQHPTPSTMQRLLVIGESVRDWAESCGTPALVPYDVRQQPVDLESDTSWGRYLWTQRTVLGSTTDFDGATRGTEGAWWMWYRWVADRYRTPLSITFAFVATHNHFVLDRGGKVFNRSAPVVKLPDGATEDDHLELLGVLNSSTACFWLKQVCQKKGGAVNSGGGRSDQPWSWSYEFTGTKLQEFPLPPKLPLELGRELDRLAQQVAKQEPSAVCADLVPSRVALDAARRSQERLRQRMIALQEELDWAVYHSYDLLTDTELKATTVPDLSHVPEIRLGERAFEIVLARQAAAGEVETAWFERHGSTPVTEIPERWTQGYRDVVQARIDLIEKRRDLALIERPECKRRWSTVPWEKREAEALRAWLLDRCERRDLWYGLRDGFVSPRLMTVSQLADRFRDDEDMHSVAQLYATDHLGKRDATLADVLEAVIADEHVPYLAALRYKDPGMVKRAAWEEVWEKQREEDRTGQRLDIAVPPKYKPADFRKPSYWSRRGKLDVPKERFISYPDASPDADPTLLLGWAGWDHKDQAAALVGLVTDRATGSGWGADRLTPLLAGVLELLPWVRQWHGTFDAEWGGNPAEDIAGFLTEERSKFGLAEDALRAWRPAARRGRRPKG